MMHERPITGKVTGDRIRDHVVKFCGYFDENLYERLRVCELIIRGWSGHLMLVSFDISAQPSSRFVCGKLSGKELILDDKHGAFFPTGGRHLSEKPHDISLEPIDISVSTSEFLFGDYRVLEWFKEKRKGLRFKTYLEKLQ